MRWKWFLGICAFVILALMVTVYVVLATYDYNELKPWVSRMVKDATGRELGLDGEVDFTMGLSPTLVVTDVTFGNASWGSQPQMIKIERLMAQVRLFPLLFKNLELKHINLDGAEVLLETDSKGQGNWDFGGADGPEKTVTAFKPAKANIDSIRINNLSLAFRQGKTGAVKRFTLERLDVTEQGAGDVQTLDLKAEYSGQPVVLSGTIGLLRDVFARRRFALQLSGELANTAFKLNGAIDDVLQLQGIDVEAQLNGENLAAIGTDLEIRLPQTATFNVKGHLKGSRDALKLEGIKGDLSGSHIDMAFSGSVGNLPAFSGVDLNVKSSGKDLAAMGPLIGAELPATDDYKIQGRLTGSVEALALNEARGSAGRGSLRFTIIGAVKDILTLRGMDLQSKLSGTDLADFGEIITVKLPATDEFEIQGRLTGSTEALALQEAHGSARRGGISLKASGVITQLLTFEGLNLKIDASGKELAEIGPLFGAELPGLGPFDVSGKLLSSPKAISLDEFSAKVDKSDFKGLVKAELLERPKITLRLESSVIDFTAMMKSLEEDDQKTVEKDRPTHRLFPDDPLPFDILKKVDADIVLKARNIHAKEAHIESGHLVLKLKDSNFSIDKLKANYKETKVAGNLQITAGAPSGVAANVLIQNFNLGDFLKETGKNDQVRAILDIAAHGKSKGDTIHSLMAALDGSIGFVMGEGYLTKYLDMLSSGLSQKVFQIWKPQEAADQIKCAVVQFDIKEGVAASQAFVFDTRAGVLTGEGEINLGTEKIDFLLVPKPENPELSLLTNLRVSGTIMDPQVSPDKIALFTKGAEALASLAVGPIALLAPFVHLGAHKKHPCDVPSIGQSGLQDPAPE
jgi:uncharacterized protein involved in outer membrane biogenesis